MGIPRRQAKRDALFSSENRIPAPNFSRLRLITGVHNRNELEGFDRQKEGTLKGRAAFRPTLLLNGAIGWGGRLFLDLLFLSTGNQDGAQSRKLFPSED